MKEGGISALFTSGTFVWYLNIIVILYIILFVLIVIESVKMHGIYSPIRIFVYSMLSFMMAQLTIIVLGLIVAVTLIYLVFKIIGFFLFSSRRRRNRREEEEDDESTGDILRGGLQSFKKEVLDWEEELKAERETIKKTVKPTQKSRPKVRIHRKKTFPKKECGNEVPRLHPD
jgi:hypothetical protein